MLYVDDLVCDFGRFEVPHPYIAQRPFNLIPLAEIAPETRRSRGTDKTVAADSRPRSTRAVS